MTSCDPSNPKNMGVVYALHGTRITSKLVFRESDSNSGRNIFPLRCLIYTEIPLKKKAKHKHGSFRKKYHPHKNRFIFANSEGALVEIAAMDVDSPKEDLVISICSAKWYFDLPPSYFIQG